MKPWHLEEHPDLEEQRRECERTWEPLNPRTKLTRKQIAALFLAQQGKCPICAQKLQTKGHAPVEFTDEHMQPRWQGGSEDMGNRALVCRPCAKAKTAGENTERCKGLAVRDKYIGAFPKKPQSRFRKKLNGQVVCRETGEVIGGRS